MSAQVSTTRGSRRRSTAVARLGVLALIGATLVGCGYSHQGLFPDNVRTVAVPIFENRSFYRDVEFDLTEALIKQIERDTPYKVVASDAADSVITGSVVAVDQSVLSRTDPGGLPQELEMRVVVNFQWTDAHSGNVMRSRRGLAAVGRYIPAQRIGQPLELARHQAVANMAQAVVDAMRSDW